VEPGSDEWDLFRPISCRVDDTPACPDYGFAYKSLSGEELNGIY